MSKRFLVAGAVAILVIAGGGYIYEVQQFDKDAHALLSTLEALKPAVKFQKLEIDKYSFNIKLMFLEISPSTLGGISTPNGIKLPDIIDHTGIWALSYNPITKTLTCNRLGKGGISLLLNFGSEKKEVQADKPGGAKLTISFKNSPKSVSPDLKSFFKNVKQFTLESGPASYTEKLSGKNFISHEGYKIHLSLTLPGKGNDKFDINGGYSFKNLTPGPLLFEQLSNQMPSLFLLGGRDRSGSVNFGFKMQGPFVASLGDGKQGKSIDFLTGVQHLDFFLKGFGEADLGKGEQNLSIRYDQFSKKVNFDLASALTFSPSSRKVIASSGYIQNYFAATFPYLTPPSEGEVMEMLPDLGTVGKIQVGMKIDANLGDYAGVGDISINTNNYSVHAAATVDPKSTSKMTIEVTNHAKLFEALNSYFDRLMSNESMKTLASTSDPTGKAAMLKSFTQTLTMAQTTLESIGKIEKNNSQTTLKIEQEIPAGILMPIIMGPMVGALSQQRSSSSEIEK